jgi:small conductance mechanosensitive channel
VVDPIREATRSALEPRGAPIALALLGVASYAMPGAHFYTAAITTEQWVSAVVILVIAIVIARVVDRLLSRRGQQLSLAVAGGDLSPVTATRLRLVRRLIFALIVVIGIAVALSRIPSVKSIATGVLASSAVLGLVVGFAARQTLANAIAGILLAVTQPIRIGDLVTFEEETGEVEDIRLTYTYIRLDDGRRLIVPNERLAQSSIENHTIVDTSVQVNVSVWLAPDADLDRAIELINDDDQGVSAAVAETDKEGVRLSATMWCENPAERGKAAAELRRRWLGLLREHGLSSAGAS